MVVMKVLLVEKMLMMIPMVPGEMTTTMVMIFPSGREFPRQIGGMMKIVPSELDVVVSCECQRSGGGKIIGGLPDHFLRQEEEVRRRGGHTD